VAVRISPPFFCASAWYRAYRGVLDKTNGIGQTDSNPKGDGRGRCFVTAFSRFFIQ